MSTAPPALWSARPPASPWPLLHCGNNYALPYRALRRLLALSEARGYEPESSTPRILLALLMWWFEPLEDSVDEARQAREGFIGVGDLGNAAYTFVPTVRALLECAPSLDACVAELDAGLAFVRRIGSANMVEVLETYQWVIDALRGERPTATGGPASIAGYSDTPATLLQCVQHSSDGRRHLRRSGRSRAPHRSSGALGVGLAHRIPRRGGPRAEGIGVGGTDPRHGRCRARALC